jgi:hypothetical protein
MPGRLPHPYTHLLTRSGQLWGARTAVRRISKSRQSPVSLREQEGVGAPTCTFLTVGVRPPESLLDRHHSFLKVILFFRALRERPRTSSVQSRSICNQTHKFAQAVGAGTSCPRAGIHAAVSFLATPTFCHLQTQQVWQPYCLFQLRRSIHRSFRWRHKRRRHDQVQ